MVKKVLELQRALHGEVTVVAQPVVALAQGRILGYEFLARGPGFLGDPRRLFALAAARGQTALLDQVCLECGARAASGLRRGELAFFNLEPLSLVELASQAPNIFRGAGGVVIEVTERPAAGLDLAAAARRWRERGFLLALDDVGAGRDGILRLVELAPDFLKLDRSLVANCQADGRRQAAIRSLLRLARDLGARVIAEGVETRAELECLKALGVELAQGFFWGPPRPVGELLPGGTA